MTPPMDMTTSPLALLNDHIFLKTDALINGQWNAGDVRLDVLDPLQGGSHPWDLSNGVRAAAANWQAAVGRQSADSGASCRPDKFTEPKIAQEFARVASAALGKPMVHVDVTILTISYLL